LVHSIGGMVFLLYKLYFLSLTLNLRLTHNYRPF